MSSRVLVALRVAASPQRAFAVFTGDIGLWWRPNDLFRFTPQDQGVLAFEPGPQGRLTQTLANGKVFENSIPLAHVARHGFPDGVLLRRHGEWWRDLLWALNTFMASRPPGSPG